jgi:hypothetical protein
MLLVSDRKSKPLSHGNSRAIGVWMSVKGQTPIQPVRVLVSYEALSQLSPTNVRDLSPREFRSVQVASRGGRKPRI